MCTGSNIGKYVREPIGTMPIQKVNTNTILNQVGLRKLWTEQHPTAVILHSHLKRMFSLAIANKYYRGDNPAAWVGHLEHILPRSKDVHRAEHHSWGRVEDGRGSLGHSATLRFPSPLIEPDVPD